MYNRQKSKRERKTIFDIRNEINNYFQPYDLEVLLTMKSMENPSPIFDELEKFISKNVRGITSSQLRKLVDLVQNVNNPEDLTIQRPQIAQMISKQPWDEAKFIMLLVDELTELTAQRGDDETKKGYDYFIQCLLGFHKYHEVLSSARTDEEKLKQLVNSDLGATTIVGISTLGNGNDPNPTLSGLENFMRQNARGITSTQLRNIYDKFLIEQPKIGHVKPFLAYTVARQRNLESVKFIYLIMQLLEKLEDGKYEVSDFMNTMQTLLSIHKYQEAINTKKLNPAERQKEIKDKLAPFKSQNLLEMKTTFVSNYGAIQEKLKSFTKMNKEGVKGSQFRRIYDEAMRATNVNEIKLLRPLFQYTAARQTHSKSQNLILFFIMLMGSMKDTPEHFQGFQALMTDLMAYHRYFEEVRNN